MFRDRKGTKHWLDVWNPEFCVASGKTFASLGLCALLAWAASSLKLRLVPGWVWPSGLPVLQRGLRCTRMALGLPASSSETSAWGAVRVQVGPQVDTEAPCLPPLRVPALAPSGPGTHQGRHRFPCIDPCLGAVQAFFFCSA